MASPILQLAVAVAKDPNFLADPKHCQPLREVEELFDGHPDSVLSFSTVTLIQSRATPPGYYRPASGLGHSGFVSLRLRSRAALKRGVPDSATSTADVDVLGMDLPPFNFLFWSRYRARL